MAAMEAQVDVVDLLLAQCEHTKVYSQLLKEMAASPFDAGSMLATVRRSIVENLEMTLLECKREWGL